MKLSIGVIIGILLIVYWYVEDHPSAPPQSPATTQGYNYISTDALT